MEKILQKRVKEEDGRRRRDQVWREVRFLKGWTPDLGAVISHCGPAVALLHINKSVEGEANGSSFTLSLLALHL